MGTHADFKFSQRVAPNLDITVIDVLRGGKNAYKIVVAITDNLDAEKID